MAGWTGKRVNVSFSKPDEPSFLKKFKERVGYKEDHGLSEKFAEMPKATDEDVADTEEELPQIVSLRSGDLTQEEIDQLRSEGRLDDLLKKNSEEEGEVQGPKNRDEVSEPEVPADGRILFRKPNKRSSDGPQGKDGKKLKDGKSEESSENKSKKVKKKAHQDKKLLSFDEDEEEEEC
ncbi:uncharacterized protein KIAA1143 homolog [Eriocheir sinensis]|uniref:uncharacterized protein KIAA1143 homolog n=1 Tax=Eriocheir sinensis TaxID=95602 RepID=UPI0021C6EB51|nr:uncharacterized protein KIAA1143 homolog [Eriocheir sinensis]